MLFAMPVELVISSIYVSHLKEFSLPPSMAAIVLRTDPQWPIVIFTPHLMLPPLPQSTSTSTSTGTEPSSEPSASLFYIPLWMDLSMHALPAFVLLFGKSKLPSHATLTLPFPFLYLPVYCLYELMRRLYVFGEKVQTPSIDLWSNSTRRIVRYGIFSLGRTLRQDQWVVSVPISDGDGPSRSDHPVCRRYFWRFERVLGFEQDTSVANTAI